MTDNGEFWRGRCRSHQLWVDPCPYILQVNYCHEHSMCLFLTFICMVLKKGMYDDLGCVDMASFSSSLFSYPRVSKVIVGRRQLIPHCPHLGVYFANYPCQHWNSWVNSCHLIYHKLLSVGYHININDCFNEIQEKYVIHSCIPKTYSFFF